MRKWMKATGGAAGLVILGAGTLGFGAQIRYDRTFPVPEPALSASTDAAVIERGRYLVYGPAHCAYCHTPTEKWPELDAGETPPMTGGAPFETPLGTIRSANITPDVATGIGAVSDGGIARMLRHNVKRDGRTTVPFMEYQNMSDDDIVAIISYLRSTAPAEHAVAETRYTPLGKALMAYVIGPVHPTDTPARFSPAADGSILRGEYLASHVANCAGCHSQRDLKDGSYIGHRFAGGMRMASEADPSVEFVTPNLTPHPEYGVLAGWTEDQFVARFRAGPLQPGTHMPWAAYGRMSDSDLRAVYRFLTSLEPVPYDPGPVVQRKGD
jgi:mono/diheme cytochrome c family protein